MAIKKDILHPDGQPEVDIYPKTNIDQVEGLSTELETLHEDISKISIKLYYHRIALSSSTYGTIRMSIVNADATPINNWSSIIDIFGSVPTNMNINLPDGSQGIGRVFISDPSINYKYITISNDGVVQGGFSGYLTNTFFTITDSVRSL